MDQQSTAQPASPLKTPLSRPQTMRGAGGFGALLLGLALFLWFRPAGGSSGPPPKPVAMPAVISQGREDKPPKHLPKPSSHEEAVRRENLQALADHARSTTVDTSWTNPSDSAPAPVEMPAVMPQGPEEPTPVPLAPPSSHEEAVRRENLQAMADKARSAAVDTN